MCARPAVAMRVSVLVLLFVALSSVACAPLASADANISLYLNPDCTLPFGEPAQLPFPSSPACQTVAGLSASFRFSCVVDANASTTHFKLAQYNNTNCSDTLVEAIDSDGPSEQCVEADVTLRGQQIPLWSQVSCSTAAASLDAHSPLAALSSDADETSDVSRAAEEAAEGAERPSIGALLHKLQRRADSGQSQSGEGMGETD